MTSCKNQKSSENNNITTIYKYVKLSIKSEWNIIGMFSNNPLGLVYIWGGGVAAADGTQIQQRPIASSNYIFYKSNSIFEKSKTEIEPILY